MRGSMQIQDRRAEARIFRFRIWVSIIASGIFLIFLLGRLIYLQVIRHEHLSMLSQNNRIRLMVVAPTRGLIFDRNGRLLAQNQPNYQLEITPEQISNMQETLEKIGTRIHLQPTDIERFKKNLRHRNSFEGIPLRFNLSDEEVARFAIDKHLFPGVDIVARLSRHYPYGALGVHAIGYIGRIDENDLEKLDKANYKATTHIGKLGVEQYYEQRLHGQAGIQQAEVNVEGRILRVLDETPPISGDNLELSLDIELQKKAEAALGEFNGSIVAIIPKTGEILAFVSKPAYDPHPFVNGISTKNYQQLRDDPARPLYNRTMMGMYPPGSTLKPLLGLAALENKVTHAERSLYCKGFYILPGNTRRFRDWRKEGHGHVNLNAAIEQSCDVYFYDLSLRLGIDRLASYLQRFGLGRKTGIDLPGEKSGLVPTPEWKRKIYRDNWYSGETLNVGIGQGYLQTSALQLASAIATFANNGHPLKPRLLRSITDPTQNKTTPIDPQANGEAIAIQQMANWTYIKTAMQNVLHGAHGTARGAGLAAPYKMAGKTGTAQVIGVAQNAKYDASKIDKKFHDHALFIGYAPADDPQIAVAIVAENGGSGGHIAAPIARKIFDAYLLKPR